VDNEWKDTTMHDLFTVSGTKFALPAIPSKEDIDPDLFDKITKRRDDILAKAAKVGPLKHSKPRGFKGPKPGNGDFVPEPGKPGDVITVDGREFEVWDAAPGVRQVWVTHRRLYFRIDLRTNAVTPNPAELFESEAEVAPVEEIAPVVTLPVQEVRRSADINPGEREMELWHVQPDTETGAWVAMDYNGNGGFGPVNVWEDGWLVPVRYRHVSDDDVSGICPLCLPIMAVA
jgi:hypothetical protein